MLIAWSFWIACCVVIVLIFWWLWRYTSKIEREEQEEQYWLEYINHLHQSGDHDAAAYWQQQFEARFLK